MWAVKNKMATYNLYIGCSVPVNHPNYEAAMLRRVDEFKEKEKDKSQFNDVLQNTFFKALSTALDLKVQVDKALGEDNLKKLRKAIDDILLLGL